MRKIALQDPLEIDSILTARYQWSCIVEKISYSTEKRFLMAVVCVCVWGAICSCYCVFVFVVSCCRQDAACGTLKKESFAYLSSSSSSSQVSSYVHIVIIVVDNEARKKEWWERAKRGSVCWCDEIASEVKWSLMTASEIMTTNEGANIDSADWNFSKI